MTCPLPSLCFYDALAPSGPFLLGSTRMRRILTNLALGNESKELTNQSSGKIVSILRADRTRCSLLSSSCLRSRKADAEDRAAQKVPKNKAAGKGRKAEPAEPVDPALPSEPDEAALALESRQLLANASGGGDTEGGDAEGVDDEGEGDKKINNNNDKKKKRSVISNDLKAKMRGEDPRAKVLLCMYKRNRPGNAATVEGFTGHKIPKGIVQNILEDLSKTGELCAKEGKNKVYWFNQELFRSKCLNLTKLNKDVEDRGEALSTCQEERACVEKKLKELEATPAEVDLGRIVEELASRYG